MAEYIKYKKRNDFMNTATTIFLFLSTSLIAYLLISLIQILYAQNKLKKRINLFLRADSEQSLQPRQNKK